MEQPEQDMTTDIIDSIITNNVFGKLIFLQPKDYKLVGIEEDAPFIKDGWEVYVANTDDHWYFLYHPERQIISMRFTRTSCLFGSLYNRLRRAKKDYEKPEKKGVGDLVKMVAQPIAKGIDAVAGTDLQNCSGCEQRRQALNKMFFRN